MADRKLNEQYEGWKKSMTDYQYKHLLELIEKVDALTHENDSLHQKLNEKISDGMTDYQLKRFVEVDEERRALKTENTILREKCEKLMQELEWLCGKGTEDK